MTREELKALGLTDEQINSIMGLHGTSTNTLRSDLASAKSSLEETQAQLKERDSDLAELREQSERGSELESKIKALEEKNAKAKAEHEKQVHALRLDAALESAISKAKGKNTRAIRALIEEDKLSFLDDGSLYGLDLDAIKKSDPYLFEEKEAPQFAGFTPGGKPSSKETSTGEMSLGAALRAHYQSQGD